MPESNSPAFILESIGRWYSEYAEFLKQEHLIDMDSDYNRHTHDYVIRSTIEGLQLMSRNNFKLAQRIRDLGDDAVLPVRETTDHHAVRTAIQSSGNDNSSVRRQLDAERVVHSKVYPPSRTLPDTKADPGVSHPPTTEVWFRHENKSGEMSVWHRLREVSFRNAGFYVQYLLGCSSKNYVPYKDSYYPEKVTVELGLRPDSQFGMICKTCWKLKPPYRIPMITALELANKGIVLGRHDKAY